jgi:hypothetical protein
MRAASSEHFIGDRLLQVIVGACVQGAHDVGRGVVCGGHDDRRRRTFAPQLLQNGETVTVGQLEVQDDGIVGRRQRHGPSTFGIARDVDLVAVTSKDLLHEVGYVLIVFDYEDSHARGGLRPFTRMNCHRIYTVDSRRITIPEQSSCPKIWPRSFISLHAPNRAPIVLSRT